MPEVAAIMSLFVLPVISGRGETDHTLQSVISGDVKKTQAMALGLHVCWGLTLGLVTQEHSVRHP